VKAEELPEEMRKMSTDERAAHVAKKQAEREAIQKEIAKTSAERQKCIEAEMKKQNLNADASFDQAVRRSIQEQAAKQLNK
jgi:hypothetical protein